MKPKIAKDSTIHLIVSWKDSAPNINIICARNELLDLEKGNYYSKYKSSFYFYNEEGKKIYKKEDMEFIVNFIVQ